jgi:vitamin B12 transporter
MHRFALRADGRALRASVTVRVPTSLYEICAARHLRGAQDRFERARLRPLHREATAGGSSLKAAPPAPLRRPLFRVRSDAFPLWMPCAALLAVPPALAQPPTLDTVVVTASRTPTRVADTLADVTVLEREDIQRSPQSSLVELLGAQPGLEFTQNGGVGQVSGVFIRGASSGGTLVLVDGVRVGSATVGTTALDQIPLEQVDRVEILRGPASSLYGADAVGGVIQIFTRRGLGPPAFNASAGYGTYGTFIGALGGSGQVGAARFAVRAGYERSSSFSAVDNPQSILFNPDRDGYGNASLSASTSYAFGADREVGASLFVTNGTTRYDGVGFDPAFVPRTDFDFRLQQRISMLSAYYRHRISSAWESTLRVSQGQDSATNVALDPSATNEQRELVRTTQNQIVWQNDLTSGWGRFMLAAEYRGDRVKSDLQYAVTTRDVYSGVGGWQHKVGANNFQASVRYDDNSQFGGRTTGTLAYGYDVTQRWRATVSAGTAFRAPSFNDLYFPNFGNPDLQPESSRNVEAGLRYEDPRTRASLVAYYNRVTDLITVVCDPLFILCRPVNVGEALLRGITLSGGTQVAGLDVSGSLDLQDPTDEQTGSRLVRRATHYGTVRIARAFGRLALRAEVVASGDRYADPANTERLPGYALLNFYAGYTLAPGWTLFGRLTNTLDQNYTLVPDYATPGRMIFAGIRYSPSQ